MIRLVSGIFITACGSIITVSSARVDQMHAAVFGLVVSAVGLYLIWTWRS